MSKLNFYYHNPTISPAPVDRLIEENEINNLKQKNMYLWAGIIILIALSTTLFHHAITKYDVNKKKSP